MKFLIAFALAVAVVSADVSHVVTKSGDAGASIVRSEADVKPDGFQYSYETSNGISANSHGEIKDFNSDHPSQVVTGEFQYPSPDGTPIKVTYVADENGFQPQGDHIPVGPEIPEAIARSLVYNAAHPQAEDKFVPKVVSVQPGQAYNKPVAAARKPFQKF